MKGFTLIETLVAVTILTLAVAGPLYAASRSIVAAEIARDQLTASYLAQEGIEYVRAQRDNQYLALYGSDTSGAWNSFLLQISPCTAPNVCSYDPMQGASQPLASCASGTCAPLSLALSGVYTQQSLGTQTEFTRSIQAQAISSKEEKITSTVSWSFHGTTYTVAVSDHLTPWQ